MPDDESNRDAYRDANVGFGYRFDAQPDSDALPGDPDSDSDSDPGRGFGCRGDACCEHA